MQMGACIWPSTSIDPLLAQAPAPSLPSFSPPCPGRPPSGLYPLITDHEPCLLPTADNCARACVLGSLNNDGYLDLIVCNAGQGNAAVLGQTDSGREFVTYYHGKADGTFETWKSSMSGLDPFNVSFTASLAVGDITNDGWLDLIAVGSYGIKLYLGGQGGFTESTDGAVGDLRTITPVGCQRSNPTPAWVTLADLNDDGTLDAWVNYQTHGGCPLIAVSVFKDGAFEDGAFTQAAVSGLLGSLQALGDFNGDGVLDAITRLPGIDAYAQSSKLVLGNPVSGGILNATLAHTDFTNTPVERVEFWQAGDLDGDGDLDVCARLSPLAHIE